MLKVTGYEMPGNTLILTWFAVGLLICGNNNRAAQSDVCIIHPLTTILLLLQEDKIAHNHNEPEPQMMAMQICGTEETVVDILENASDYGRGLEGLDGV